MKLFFSFLVILLSINSFSHCGTCGEGEAEDHQERGEDSTHHNSDQPSVQDQSENDQAPVQDLSEGDSEANSSEDRDYDSENYD